MFYPHANNPKLNGVQLCKKIRSWGTTAQGALFATTIQSEVHICIVPCPLCTQVPQWGFLGGGARKRINTFALPLFSSLIHIPDLDYHSTNNRNTSTPKTKPRSACSTIEPTTILESPTETCTNNRHQTYKNTSDKNKTRSNHCSQKHSQELNR